uniref:Sm domain-containing protein n=1 Tax=Vitis vinifera TaxID=29760 RepID=F6H3B8_VITVI
MLLKKSNLKKTVGDFLGVGCAKFNYMAMEHDAEKSFIHVESSEGSNPNGSNPVTKVRMLLFRRMLVGVSDGRFFLGSFHCMDKQGNIILQDTVEYRSTRRSSPSPMEQRCLGLILIPFSCRTSCHVDCSIEEQLSLLSLPG